MGVGATAVRVNQIVVGSASSTVTLPGLTTAASTNAQSGTIYTVTTDAQGNLAAVQGDGSFKPSAPAAVTSPPAETPIATSESSPAAAPASLQTDSGQTGTVQAEISESPTTSPIDASTVGSNLSPRAPQTSSSIPSNSITAVSYTHLTLPTIYSV